VSHISRPRCWGKSALPSRSSGIFLSSDGEGRRLEDLGRTKINRVFGRPLAEPLNVSECASLAEPPKTLLQQPLQLWRTLLLEFAVPACHEAPKSGIPRAVAGIDRHSHDRSTSFFIVARVVAAAGHHERCCWLDSKSVLLSANKGRDDPRRRRLL
jgi:hypothetical protein